MHFINLLKHDKNSKKIAFINCRFKCLWMFIIFGVDASVCHFLVCKISNELIDNLEPNVHGYNIAPDNFDNHQSRYWSK